MDTWLLRHIDTFSKNFPVFAVIVGRNRLRQRGRILDRKEVAIIPLPLFVYAGKRTKWKIDGGLDANRFRVVISIEFIFLFVNSMQGCQNEI